MSQKGLAVLWSLAAVGAFRGWQIVQLWMSGNPLGMVFAVSEATVLFFTCGALVYGAVDGSWKGLVTPLLYAVPTMLRPNGSGYEWAGYVLLGLCLVQIGLRGYLGRCLTSGVPVFVELRDRGPYEYIRHPLALTEIVIALAFVLRFQTAPNFAIAGLCVLGSVGALLIEEAFLRRERVYRVYMASVPYRLIPNVW